MSFSLIACGGGEEGAAEESANASYHIKLDGKGGEDANENNIGFSADHLTHETTFTIHDAKLYVTEMDEDFGNDPMSIIGKTYDAVVTTDAEYSGSITITDVKETGKDDMKTDYDVAGTIKADGHDGSFKVSLFKMNH